MTYKVLKITQTNLLRTNTICFHLRGYKMSALFLELAIASLFFSSSPHTLRLKMIFSIVVLAPLGEVAKSLPVVRLATHKLIVSVDAVLGVELLATTLAGKHIATVLQILCWLSICKDLKALSQTLQG